MNIFRPIYRCHAVEREKQGELRQHAPRSEEKREKRVRVERAPFAPRNNIPKKNKQRPQQAKVHCAAITVHRNFITVIFDRLEKQLFSTRCRLCCTALLCTRRESTAAAGRASASATESVVGRKALSQRSVYSRIRRPHISILDAVTVSFSCYFSVDIICYLQQRRNQIDP